MTAATESQGRESLALVERIRSGERLAEVELVRRYGRGVRLLIEQRVGSRELAQDLFQETFRLVLMRLRSRVLPSPEHLTGFIRQTAINVTLMDQRKRARRQRVETGGLDVEQAPDAYACPYTRAAHEELRSSVRALIQELPVARDRTLLWHYYVLEEDKAALCARLGLSGDHFDRVLSRARSRLRELLARSGL